MSIITLDTKKLFEELDAISYTLQSQVSSVDEQQLNSTPFEDSWTPAQLAIHVTKSNNAIAQGLRMNGRPANRNIDEAVPQLKKMFLDFGVKYKSPQFIVPEEGNNDKQEIIEALKRSIERLKTLRNEIDLSEMISLPPFGEVTKLELLHFVLYHTTRHVHQLNNMIHLLQNKHHVNNNNANSKKI